MAYELCVYLVSIVDLYGEEFALFAVEPDFFEVGSEREDGEFDESLDRFLGEVDAVDAKDLMADFERAPYFAPVFPGFARHCSCVSSVYACVRARLCARLCPGVRAYVFGVRAYVPVCARLCLWCACVRLVPNVLIARYCTARCL